MVAYLAIILLGAVVTPIGEESFFRGVLTNALGRYGGIVAVVVSAALFVLAHRINPVFPLAFVIGIATALIVRRSGSLWPGFMVRGVNKALAATVPLIWVAWVN